jgi:hypothetical protein
MVVRSKDKLTYEVLSETVHQQHYLVDLSENAGNGECSCADFGTRRAPKLKATGKIVNYGHPDATRCKHINACLVELGSLVLERMNGRA